MVLFPLPKAIRNYNTLKTILNGNLLDWLDVMTIAGKL